MPEKMIRIAESLHGLETVSYKLLHDLQGNLKVTFDYAVLKKSLRDNDFFVPKYVWENPQDGLLYIMDGHQTVGALKELEAEGWIVPPIPIVRITAQDKKEAKKKLLLINSRFAYFQVDAKFFAEWEPKDWSNLLADIAIPELAQLEIEAKRLDAVAFLQQKAIQMPTPGAATPAAPAMPTVAPANVTPWGGQTPPTDAAPGHDDDGDYDAEAGDAPFTPTAPAPLPAGTPLGQPYTATGGATITAQRLAPNNVTYVQVPWVCTQPQRDRLLKLTRDIKAAQPTCQNSFEAALFAIEAYYAVAFATTPTVQAVFAGKPFDETLALILDTYHAAHPEIMEAYMAAEAERLAAAARAEAEKRGGLTPEERAQRQHDKEAAREETRKAKAEERAAKKAAKMKEKAEAWLKKAEALTGGGEPDQAALEAEVEAELGVEPPDEPDDAPEDAA